MIFLSFFSFLSPSSHPKRAADLIKRKFKVHTFLRQLFNILKDKRVKVYVEGCTHFMVVVL